MGNFDYTMLTYNYPQFLKFFRYVKEQLLVQSLNIDHFDFEYKTALAELSSFRDLQVHINCEHKIRLSKLQ